MSDKFEEYLLENLNVHHRSGDELILRECLACRRPMKMYVNVVKLRFNCYSAHCEARGSLVRLIQLIEDTDLIGAVQKVKELTSGQLRVRSSSQLKQLLDRMLAGNIEELAEDHGIKVPLPPEFTPCYSGKRKPKWQIPPYLKLPKPRGRALAKADLQRWGIGYCGRGDYGGRIVVPVECQGMTSFVARAIESHTFPKYLNPGQGFQSSVLFGYDEVLPGLPIYPVEGVFHAIRLWSYGYQAVAYFGSYISVAQALLIAQRKPSEVVWIPDADAYTKALEQTARILPIIGPMKLGRIDQDGFKGDCDDADEDHIASVIAEAQSVDTAADLLGLRLGALRNPWE